MPESTPFRARRGPVGLRRPGGLLALPLLLAGCLSGRALNPFDSSQNLDPVVLQVVNQNLYDATLYVFRGKQRQELGTISSGTIQYFNFGWPGGTPLAMEIELLMGDRFRPAPFPFSGGGHLLLVIAPELRRSSLSYGGSSLTLPASS